MVLPIKMNDEIILHFILDTGVRSTIIFNKDLTDSLGIKYQREVELFGAGNLRPVDAFVADEVSLSMPGIKSSKISALVLKEDFLQLDRHLGTQVHGLIGYDIFSRFIVKIDYRKEKITLYEPGKFTINKKFDTVKLTIKDSKPIAGLNIRLDEDNRFKAQLLVDTGASHALALDRNSNENIKLPEKYISSSLGRGLSGEITGYIGRINKIELGENGLDEVITAYPENTFRTYDKGVFRNGSVGGELLKKFTVIFNFVQEEMYLKPNKAYNQPFEYNMSGIEFTAHGKYLDTYIIYRVRENSAAYIAGFLPGDVLVSLNNMSSKKLNLSRIYDELNSKAGERIDLTVQRDGKYISRTMYIKREL